MSGKDNCYSNTSSQRNHIAGFFIFQNTFCIYSGDDF